MVSKNVPFTDGGGALKVGGTSIDCLYGGPKTALLLNRCVFWKVNAKKCPILYQIGYYLSHFKANIFSCGKNVFSYLVVAGIIFPVNYSKRAGGTCRESFCAVFQSPVGNKSGKSKTMVITVVIPLRNIYMLSMLSDFN